jgi:hypothetical protein
MFIYSPFRDRVPDQPQAHNHNRNQTATRFHSSPDSSLYIRDPNPRTNPAANWPDFQHSRNYYERNSTTS